MTEHTQLHTAEHTYSAAGDTMHGYLAYDAGQSGSRPGVLVFPEWWGLNDYIQQRTRMIAELGYVALGVDMYGGGQLAGDPDKAGAMMTAVLDDMETGTARISAAHAALCDLPQVDATRTAAIGYCFGGAMVLHAARIGMELKAVASFHGALGSFHQPGPGEVRARVLVCHGADDEFVSAAEVEDFKAEMQAAGADFEFISYPGAKHGFSSEAASANGASYGLPLAYDANADRASWTAMQALFAEVLG